MTGDRRIRVAIVGVSHWHLDLYLTPLTDIVDVDVVAVCDPQPGVAREVAERIGAAWFTDVDDLCATSPPDFAFVLGTHDSMTRSCHRMIDAGVPFVVEKPAGTELAAIGELAARARRSGHFAAVPLVWRNSDLLRVLESETAGLQQITFASLRWIAGSPDRYRASRCDWMLDPRRSGGGCAVNLGVHLVDMARMLIGPDARIVSASFDNASFGERVEDHAILVVGDDTRRVTIETGYLMPSAHAEFDMRLSFRTPDRYIVAVDPDTVEIRDGDRIRTVHARTTNVPHYRDFVVDTLHRWRTRQRPLADLDTLHAALGLIAEAYASGSWSAGTNPVHIELLLQ